MYTRQTKEGNGIWIVDQDGKNAREILKEVDGVTPFGAFWSPDGNQLAVVLSNWVVGENGTRSLPASRDVNWRIEIMDADGSHRRELKLADAKVEFIEALGDWR